MSKIFQLLIEKNISAKNFAGLIGVSQGNVSDWKSGKAKPSITALAKIARYFNVSADYLLGLSEIPVPLNRLSKDEQILIKKYKENPEILPLLNLYNSLSDKDKGNIMGRLEVMAENKRGGE